MTAKLALCVTPKEGYDQSFLVGRGRVKSPKRIVER